EEEHHDDDDEESAVAQRFDDVIDGDLDEIGLTEDSPIDRHAARQLLLQRVELAIEPRCQLDGIRARLLLDADDDRRLAVARPLAAFQRGALAYVRHVANEDGPIAAHGHHAVADLVRRPDAPDRLQYVLLRAFDINPCGRVLAGAPNGLEQLVDGDVVRPQL